MGGRGREGGDGGCKFCNKAESATYTLFIQALADALHSSEAAQRGIPLSRACPVAGPRPIATAALAAQRPTSLPPRPRSPRPPPVVRARRLPDPISPGSIPPPHSTPLPLLAPGLSNCTRVGRTDTGTSGSRVDRHQRPAPPKTRQTRRLSALHDLWNYLTICVSIWKRGATLNCLGRAAPTWAAPTLCTDLRGGGGVRPQNSRLRTRHAP